MLNTPVLCFGEILWDMLPSGPQPGGAPLNVAYHLGKLGIPTGIMSRVGNDDNGRKLTTLIRDWGIKGQYIQVDDTYATSEVIATVTNGHEVSYEIVHPVAWDFINYNAEVAKHISPATYLVYGSLASRSDITRDTLFRLLETDAIKVFDVNLRPPFIDRKVLEHLLRKADIVKFNQAELDAATLFFNGPAGSEPERVKFVMEHFGIKEVIITKGEHGAAYYWRNNVARHGGMKIKVNDTIGSGDSFLAAFIAGHYLNESPDTILKNAIAMGSFIATKKGGCPEYQHSELRQFKAEPAIPNH